MAALPGSDATVAVFGGKGWIWGSGDAGVVSVWNTDTDVWNRVVPAGSVRRRLRAGLIAQANTPCARQSLPSVRSGAGFVRGKGMVSSTESTPWVSCRVKPAEQRSHTFVPPLVAQRP